jgi:hypothetical protein
MFYGDIFRGLAADNIRYAVTGGVALVLHGVVRLTDDLERWKKALNDHK